MTRIGTKILTPNSSQLISKESRQVEAHTDATGTRIQARQVEIQKFDTNRDGHADEIFTKTVFEDGRVETKLHRLGKSVVVDRNGDGLVDYASRTTQNVIDPVTGRSKENIQHVEADDNYDGNVDRKALSQTSYERRSDGSIQKMLGKMERYIDTNFNGVFDQKVTDKGFPTTSAIRALFPTRASNVEAVSIAIDSLLFPE